MGCDKRNNDQKPSVNTRFLIKYQLVDCVIKILSKLFSNQQEGALETFET